MLLNHAHGGYNLANSIDPMVAPASITFLGGGRGSRKKMGGNWKNMCNVWKNLLFLPFLCWNCQIWFNFNAFVIIGGKLGVGQKNIFGTNAPCGTPTELNQYLLDRAKY